MHVVSTKWKERTLQLKRNNLVCFDQEYGRCYSECACWSDWKKKKKIIEILKVQMPVQLSGEQTVWQGLLCQTKEQWFQTTRGEMWFGYKEEVLYSKDGEALEQVALISGGAPSLETVQIRLDQAVSTWWSCGCLCSLRGWDKMACKGPFQLKACDDSVKQDEFCT